MASHYETGYGKPPKHTRFKKGCSGNPAGRPKGSKGLVALQEKILSEKVLAIENGRRMKISKRELIMRQLGKMAVTGNIRAIQLLLGIEVAAEERASKIAQHDSRDVTELTDEELMEIIRRGETPDGE
jgi:hypothetical protein